MKDVAILTKFYKNYNYGGMLQGYALQRVLSNLGYTADIVSYDVSKNTNPVYPNIFIQAKQYGVKNAIAKVGEKIISKGNFFIKKLLSERVNKFNLFMYNAGLSSEVYSDDSMHLLKGRYKTFISGSDQVWNPNAVRNMYLQTFCVQKKRKISYAASIGREKLSEFEASALIPSIRRFGSISVRENTAKKLLEQYIEDPITTVLDPTMLLTVEEWANMATSCEIKGKYALFYFFSDSLKVRRKSAEFCRKHGLKLVMIPYAKQEYNLTDQIGPGIRYGNVGPYEFVSLIRNADFVLTDSFHGAVFSLIHKVPFAVFERSKSGHVSMNSRLYDLLIMFDESNRLIDISRIYELDSLLMIDSDKIQRILDKKKLESLSFLKSALEKGIAEYEHELSFFNISGEEYNCSGCGACAQLCPKSCISMNQNENGFIVPVIDKDKCISCGKCRRICPMQGNVLRYKTQKTYGAYSKHEERGCASGGMSFLISSEFLLNDGIVYGASYDDNLDVKIIRVDRQEQLVCTQGSKYVQANMCDSLSQIIADLKAGRKVLFTGTPCEIAGVKAISIAKKLDANLYTAEIVCHGTPSPRMFSDYLSWAERYYGKKITSYSFRKKNKDTDKDFMIHIGFYDGSERYVSGFKDPYYKLFLSSRWFRECCYECPFAIEDRVADITLGDFWNSERLPRNFGKNRRISVVLVNSEKGKSLLKSVKDRSELVVSKIEIARSGNVNLYRSTRRYSGYVGYGSEGLSLIQKSFNSRLDLKKYIFNQLPIGIRRAFKRAVGNVRN